MSMVGVMRRDPACRLAPRIACTDVTTKHRSRSGHRRRVPAVFRMFVDQAAWHCISAVQPCEPHRVSQCARSRDRWYQPSAQYTFGLFGGLRTRCRMEGFRSGTGPTRWGGKVPWQLYIVAFAAVTIVVVLLACRGQGPPGGARASSPESR